MTFDELHTANLQRLEQVFHPIDAWTPADWACALAGEVGEVCNAVKKLRRVSDGTNTNIEKDPQNETEAIAAIAYELADTVIYADLLAARLGIDLTEAIRFKFNLVSARRGSSIHL